MRPFISSVRRTSIAMARILSPSSFPLAPKFPPSISLFPPTPFSPHSNLLPFSSFSCSSSVRRSFHVSSRNRISPLAFGGFFTNQRGYRKTRRGLAAVKKQAPKEKKLELNVSICIEEELPEDPEVLVRFLGFDCKFWVPSGTGTKGV